jgi:antitoxin (DNA-binding transcriptional repressor) of toxin-antitoxin stability system
MTIVITTEAEAMLPRLLASVAQSEAALITDGGLPVASLSQPDLHRLTPPAPAQTRTSEAEVDEEDDRPWRGVFAIEAPDDRYPGGEFQRSAEPSAPGLEPSDILWDRMNFGRTPRTSDGLLETTHAERRPCR